MPESELIEMFENEVFPIQAEHLLNVNYEGKGKLDKQEYLRDTSILIELAKKGLAIKQKKENAIIHARWIYDESRFMAICSHCMGNPTEGTGYGLDISTLEAKYHYCRLCGAKMDEEAEDDREHT